HGVDKQRHALFADLHVIVVDMVVERKAILKTAAAAAGNMHSQFQIGVAFFLDQFPYLDGSSIGKDQGIFLLRVHGSTHNCRSVEPIGSMIENSSTPGLM